MAGFSIGHQRREAVGELLDTRIQHLLGVGQARLGDLLVGHALDDLQHAALARGDQQQGTAFTAGAAGTADTMHVGFRIVGHVHVEHVGDARHVQAASGDVGSDDDVQAAILERFDDALTLVLGDVTVQRGGLVALGFQRRSQVQGGLLGAHEGDQRVEVLDFQQAQHGRDLLVGMHHQVCLLDAGDGLGLGGDLDVLRLAQVLFGDGADGVRQRGGEQHALAALGHGLEDHFQVVHEAQLEHFVGFVEHQELDGRQQRAVAAQVIDQAARGGNDDLRALANGLELRAHRCTTVDGDDANAGQQLGVGFEGRGDLQGQLAGRREDQRLRLAPGGVDLRQDRQREGGGLAGTGLGLADHVVATEDHRDRLGLDGGWFFVADCADGSQNSGVNTECGEAADFLGHGSCL
ncbi:hypothetical protein BAY1663_04768 [Pseudomonas sp. BAY1663]|nr:hypothetical protein BAY1663_04768 [Pseudomonas sp. BAY1663]